MLRERVVSPAEFRARTLGAIAAAVALALQPATSRAATQQELEARVQALADQLQEVQAELAELKQEKQQNPGPPAAARNAQVPPGAGALPPGTSALPPGSVASGTAAPGSAARSHAAPAAPSNATTAGQVSYGSQFQSQAAGRNGPNFFGYGELTYDRPSGRPEDSQVDLARFVLGTGYQFDDRTRFVSELEIEHAVSSAEDPGEVEIEQAYIERDLSPGIFARAGLILIPSGMLNENHEPTRYYGVFRNFIETAIIPSTWREGGVALQGTTDSGLRWDAGLTTGFDLSKWDATSTDGQESPLGSIHQELALARARDVSGFAALNYTGIPGLRAGGSVFTGGASQGRPGLPSSQVTLWEGHFRWTPGDWDFAGLYARGHISGTRQFNSTLVGNPSLVPQSFFGWYLQAAYRLFDTDVTSLTPFLRYERFNTAASYADVGPGLTPGVLPDRRVWTAGINWMFAPGVVFKVDYLDFQGGEGDRFGVGLGYQF